MSKHIATKKLEITAGEVTVKISVFKFEADNNKYLRGFASIMIYKGQEFSHSWDRIKVVENKKGELFISEPQHETMTNNEKSYSPDFLMPKAIKEDVNKLLNETFR